MAGIEKNYYNILEGLKEKIRITRQKAALAVNRELLQVYWEIGNAILQQQKEEGWGKKIISRLAKDLKSEFADMKGLSERNLVYMQTFAGAWPHYPFTLPPVALVKSEGIKERSTITQPAVAEIETAENEAAVIMQQVLAQIPWTHHTIILDKLKTEKERLFYIKKTAENGWSKSVLMAQIESGLYLRQGNAITNFQLTLPKTQSDLATETLKNPYLFDFLGISEEMQERDLEKALIQHIKKFMLELGRGFAYVGNQYNLNVEGDDFFLDLLFYNYHLHCFVVFELKVGEFKPEFAGKLNFYINTINDQIKGSHDKPTIGVLLCKTPNETVVKYSLQGIDAPMGVSEYELTMALPKHLKGELPTIEELEQEIEKEAAVLKKPIDEKRELRKQLLAKIKAPELKKERDHEAMRYLFNEVLQQIKEEAETILKEERALFKTARIERSINSNTFAHVTSVDLEARLGKENIYQLGLALRFEGFTKAGTNTFGLFHDLYIELEQYKYAVGEKNNQPKQEYLYHHQWTTGEIKLVAENWCLKIIDDMNKRLEQIIKQ